MFYQCQLGNNTSAATRHIYAVLGEGAVADHTCRDWFKRLRESNMSLEDRPRSQCLLQSDIERIKILIEDISSLTTRELSTMFDCNQSAISRHLHDIGKVNQLETLVPHQVTSNNVRAANNHQMQVFIVKTSSTQTSSTNCY